MPESPTVEPVEPIDHLQTAMALLAAAGTQDPEHTDRCVFHHERYERQRFAEANAVIATAQAQWKAARATQRLVPILENPQTPVDPRRAGSPVRPPYSWGTVRRDRALPGIKRYQ